jgi:uncharacterized protein
MSNNLETVQQIYAYFGQGNVPGILSKMSDDASITHGADPKIAPFGGTFKGKDALVNFFTALGTNTQTTNFVPSNFRVEGNQVINQVIHDGIARSTNKPYHVEVSFVWTFNEKGEAIDCTNIGDFSSMNAAFS